MNLTRRKFLRGSAIVGVAPLLPIPSAPLGLPVAPVADAGIPALLQAGIHEIFAKEFFPYSNPETFSKRIAQKMTQTRERIAREVLANNHS